MRCARRRPASARRVPRPAGRRGAASRAAMSSIASRARMDDGERPLGVDALADAGEVGQADGMVDRVLRAGCGRRRARRRRGRARASRSPARCRRARRGRRATIGRRREMRARIRRGSRAGRRAPRPCGRSARRRAPEAKRLRRSGRAPRLDVGGEAAEQQHLGAERDRHVVERGSRRRAGQVVDRVGDLERVAGGGGERLVHVGEQRASSAGRRRSRRRRGSRPARARRSSVGHEGAGADLHVHDQAVEARRRASSTGSRR